MSDILIYKELRKIRKGIKKIMSQISDFADATKAAFININKSLDNIIEDEKVLAKMIKDLQDQIGGGLSPADAAALQSVLDAANGLVVKSQGIADNVPDVPPPPPGNH